MPAASRRRSIVKATMYTAAAVTESRMANGASSKRVASWKRERALAATAKNPYTNTSAWPTVPGPLVSSTVTRAESRRGLGR